MIEENSVSTKIGLKDAYEHLAPVVDTDIYMDIRGILSFRNEEDKELKSLKNQVVKLNKSQNINHGD